jgi:mannose-1-phosphate guanylyltransferase
MSTLVHVILSGTAQGIPSAGQFIPDHTGKSLFELCLERNVSFAKQQLIVGHNEYYTQARNHFKSAGNKTFLSIIEEDHLTNIYSVAFAAFSASVEEILLVTPSYYLISDEAAYKKAVEKMILVAKENQIGILCFYPEQITGTMPFFVCEGDSIKSFQESIDSEKQAILSKNQKHFIHSGILCCKAGVYLQELKTWAPDVYQITKKAWEARVAQYVAIDINSKMPQATIEQALLMVSDNIKIVPELTVKLQIPAKNIGDQTTNSTRPHPETKSNKGPKMISMAL